MILVVVVLACFLSIGHRSDVCPQVPGLPGEWVNCIKPEMRQVSRALDLPEGVFE